MSLYLGVVYDAMRVLGFDDRDFYIDIKPEAGYHGLISGPALTTFGRKTSPDEDYPALDNIRLEIYKKKLFEKRPIVVLQANDSYVAHSGDITSLIYQTLGATGFVTDGNVRDIERIDALSFPCFCRGVNPIDALDYWALTNFNIPIEIDGVDICPGDMIYASRDGVIRVRQADQQAFEVELAKILEKENSIRKVVTEMAKAEDFTTAFEKFVAEHGRW